jgi:hypothetical protein
MPDDNSDDRPVIVVHTDHNPDKVRSFYEIPDALAQMIQPDGDSRTLAQCLADLAHPLTRDELWMATEAIGQWLDEDDEGIDKAFPESAKQLKSALAKLEAMLEQATNLDDADE